MRERGYLRKMRRVAGFGLLGMGAFLGFGVLLNAPGPRPGAVLLAWLVFGLAPAVAGYWLLKAPLPEARGLLAAGRAWDSELLRLAARRDGCLSVAEVVAYADLGAQEAEQRLDDLSRRGLCEVRVTEEGVLVYRFSQAPSAAHKRAAMGVLDE